MQSEQQSELKKGSFVSTDAFYILAKNIIVKVMEKYTTKEVANLFGVSDRAIVKRCKNAKVKMVNGKYLVPQKVLDTWMYKRNAKNQNKTEIRTRPQVLNIVPNDVQVKNLSQHQNTALLNKVESLEIELSNYRKVLEVHSRIFKTINDKLEGVSVTTQQEMNRTRTADALYKTTVKSLKPEPATNEALQDKLEKQFGVGTKHISITKELPNENAINDVNFTTKTPFDNGKS